MSAVACSSIVIVHPSPLFSEALAGVVAAVSPKLELVVVTGANAIPFEKIVEPSLFIVGGRTTGDLIDSLRSIRKRFCIRKRRCHSPIVAIGSSIEPDVVLKTLQAGATSYLHEEMTSKTIMMALELALRGETVLPSVAVGLLGGYVASGSEVSDGANARSVNGAEFGVWQEEVNRKIPGLSTRQAAILQSLIEGTSNKVIAQQLKLSEATVKLHVKAVLRKINVSNRTQAAVWAVKQHALNTNK